MEPYAKQAPNSPTVNSCGVPGSSRVANEAAVKPALPTSALRSSTPFDLDGDLVADCLLDAEADRLFAAAWEHGFASLPQGQRRRALLGVMGHIAESVVAAMLAELGYAPIWQFRGPGRHGVDLIMLAPANDHVVAIEVKSTFRPRPSPA